MLVILNSSNAHNLPIFQPISMILVSKSIVHRVLSDKTYLSLGLLSPLSVSEISMDPSTELIASVHSTANRSGDINNVQHFEVFAVYANTNIADTRIVCPICTVISSHARQETVAYWLASQTLEPEDQGRFHTGHLLQIVFLLFF